MYLNKKMNIKLEIMREARKIQRVDNGTNSANSYRVRVNKKIKKNYRLLIKILKNQIR